MEHKKNKVNGVENKKEKIKRKKDIEQLRQEKLDDFMTIVYTI